LHQQSGQILRQFYTTFNRMQRQLIALTGGDSSEEVIEYLESIEEQASRVEQYLLEEALADYIDKDSPEISFVNLPAYLMLTPHKGGLSLRNVPLWTIKSVGHRTAKNPLNNHRGRPAVRRNVFWNELIHHLKIEYLKKVWQHESNVPKVPPYYTHALLKYRTFDHDIQDLDHYSVTPIINAFVGNGFLLSDHPSRLEYTMTWDNDSANQNVLDIYLSYYSKNPAYLNNGIST